VLDKVSIRWAFRVEGLVFILTFCYSQIYFNFCVMRLDEFYVPSILLLFLNNAIGIPMVLNYWYSGFVWI